MGGTWISCAVMATAAVVVLSAASPVTAGPAVAASVATAQAAGGLRLADAGYEPPEPQDYAEEAETLPAELAAAIEHDLGISPAEYLAGGEAAVRAADLADEVEASGIEVLGVELDGLEPVVHVADEAAAEAVTATGVRAEVGEPEPFRPDPGTALEFKDDVRAGTPYTFKDSGSIYRCSLGFAGHEVADGSRRSITAGHCLGDASSMRRTVTASSAGRFDWGSAVDLGLPVPGSYRLGGGYDHGLIEVRSGRNTMPEVLTWGGGARAPLASAPVKVRDAARAVVGAPLCRSGSSSGWRCGEIVAVDTPVSIGGRLVNTIAAEVCLTKGDSGGPALSGATAVGVSSASDADDVCESDDVSFFSVLYSDDEASAQRLYGGGWEPAVAVERPVVTAPGGAAYRGTTITGTLRYGSARHRVVVVIDGSITRTAKVSSNGTWSIDISDLPAGRHSYAARAWWGKHSRSGAVTGEWGAVTADRIAGADRYSTAVAISRQGFPRTAPIVFIASGENYPDALSAGPVAAVEGGPLLLTPRTSVPASVRAELDRLNPQRIVVVGGAGAVSASVERALRAYAPTVQRLGGPDRYATSRLVADFGYDRASAVFVATGRNFPDALSAGAAGASMNAPVVLVDGDGRSLDTATRTLLAELDPDRVLIAGGEGVVSRGIADGAGRIGAVKRLAGPTRYGTSIAINAYAFGSVDRAFIALGTNFPDALAGGVLAGRSDAPMVISTPTCVPREIVDHVLDLGVTRVTLFGGTGALSSGVAGLRSC